MHCALFPFLLLPNCSFAMKMEEDERKQDVDNMDEESSLSMINWLLVIDDLDEDDIGWPLLVPSLPLALIIFALNPIDEF